MFTIGAFAAMGRVSVRMLRHYDAIGLLEPASIDEVSGYRYYRADQLRRLNRLLALKDLGFTLYEVNSILDESIEIDDLRGMLQSRQAELASQIAADTQRLGRVDARLRMIEREGFAADVDVTSVPSSLAVGVSGTADSTEHRDVSPVITALFADLLVRIEGASLPPAGPLVADYRPLPDDRLAVRACCPVTQEIAQENEDLPIVELPEFARTARRRHRGTMSTIGGAYQDLGTWLEAEGHRTDGSAREVYVVSHPEPEQDWLTDIYLPIIEPSAPA